MTETCFHFKPSLQNRITRIDLSREGTLRGINLRLSPGVRHFEAPLLLYGRWHATFYVKPNYHFIMLKVLISCSAVIFQVETDFPENRICLVRGLIATKKVKYLQNLPNFRVQDAV